MTHTIDPQITSRQIDIITGTVLGGSSIVKPKNGKNCYLSMRGKNGLWLDYKSAELSNLTSSEPITIEHTNRFHSLCYPLFNTFRNMFYTENGYRIINMDVLDSLKQLSLSVWFGDCGKFINNKVILNTHIWGRDGTEIINKYFNEIGYKSEIFLERSNYRIKMKEKDSKEYLKLVGLFLPSFFKI